MKKLMIILIALALAGGGIFYLQDQASRPRALNGYYVLSFDGLSGFQIETDAQGEPVIKTDRFGSRPARERIDRRVDGHCVLMRRLQGDWEKENCDRAGVKVYADPKTGKLEWIDLFEMVPSAKVPGDWDLVKVSDSYRSNLCVFDPPHESFLHRVEDPRVMDYFGVHSSWASAQSTAQYPALPGKPAPPATPYPQQLLDLALAMLKDHPDDLYMRILYLDALLSADRLKEARTSLDQWKPVFQASSSLRFPFHCAEWTLYSRELSAAGRNGADFIDDLFSGRFDLDSRLARFGGIMKFDAYANPHSLIPSFHDPNSLELQTMAKVFNVEACLLLLQGRRDKALELVSSTYHLGQLMTRNDTLITRLIGIAVRSIACRGLELHALNGCETAQDLDPLWLLLESLNRQEEAVPSWAKCMELEPASFMAEDQAAKNASLMANYQELATRHRVVDARFQLIRLAVAVRLWFLQYGFFPRSEQEFAPFVPGGLPKDPFTFQPLHFLNTSHGLTGYSVGPDQADNHAAIVYDPSNGTTSAGDLLLEVPYVRKYPFPREGVKATDWSDLLSQFPNGLPPDPFADTKGRPLNVTNSYPVCVFSFGPDCDEMDYKSNPHPFPYIAYDPTNGTTSRGDIFTAIPGRN